MIDVRSTWTIVVCSNRIPKCCTIGMHTVYCVTHTKASSVGLSVVWLTTMWWRQTSHFVFFSFFSQVLIAILSRQYLSVIQSSIDSRSLAHNQLSQRYNSREHNSFMITFGLAIALKLDCAYLYSCPQICGCDYTYVAVLGRNLILFRMLILEINAFMFDIILAFSTTISNRLKSFPSVSSPLSDHVR